MNGATVCSGIGAPEVAMPHWDWRLASEIEKFPCAVLGQRQGYSDLRKGRAHRSLWGDFTALRMRHLVRFDIPAPDVIVAGTPCQSFSVAGLRKGLADDRGNLTLSFVRLCDAIDNFRHHRGLDGLIGLWENVSGIFSHRDNPFGCFLAALAGCDAAIVPPRGARWTDAGVVVGPKRAVAWRVFDAQFFGLAQRRERVFVVFGPRDWPCAEALFPVGEGLRRDTAPRREERQGIAPTIAARTRGGGGLGTDFDCDGGLIAADLRNGTLDEVGHTLQSGGAGKERGLSVNSIPHALACGGGNTAGPIDKATALNAHERWDFDSETFIAHAFDARQSDVIQYDDMTGPLDTDGHTHAIAFSCKDHGADALSDLSPTLRAGGHDKSHANAGVMPAVAFAINSHAGAADGDQTNRSHASGGPVGFGVSEEVAYSLRSGRTQTVAHTAVRRLTPTECERLQGFPDGYTAVSYRGKPAADGPRYKALGNSMAVPVIRWILRRIELCASIQSKANAA